MNLKKTGIYLGLFTIGMWILHKIISWITYDESSFIDMSAMWGTAFKFLRVLGAIVIVYLSIFSDTGIKYTPTKNLSKSLLKNSISDSIKYNRPLTEIIEFNETSDPYKLDLSPYPETPWYQLDGVILGEADGHCIYRPSSGEGNLALFARPGAGKTTAQIIPTALQFGGSVLAIDIKGDILSATKNKRNIKIFSPADPEHSCHFDPFAGIHQMTPDDRRIRIDQLAEILIAEKKTGDKKEDDYFTKGARNFFIGISHYLLDTKPDTTFTDVVNAIVYGELGNAINIVLTVVNGNSETAKVYLSQYYGTTERNVAGCFGDTVDALRPLSGSLSTILNGDGDCISVDTLADGWDIYLEIPQDRISIYAPVTAMVIQSFMDEFMRRPDKSVNANTQPILFLLDEFAQLRFNFQTLSTALATLRSKNVSLFLSMQSIAQLSNRYGDAQAREIIDNCAFISVMSAQDPTSREFFSKMIGEKRVLKKSGSGSIEVTERIVPPATLGNLHDQVLIYTEGQYVLAGKCYFFKVH